MDIHEIVNSVETNALSIRNIGLLNGRAGVMTLFFYYHSFSNQQKYKDLAFRYLETMCEEIKK